MGRRKKNWLELRLLATSVDGVPFLKKCGTCKKVRDRDELFEFRFDDECLLCRRKRERVHEGLIDYEGLRSSGNKAAHRMLKAARATAEGLLEDWKAHRKVELTADGVPDWEQWQIVHEEENDVRAELGLELVEVIPRPEPAPKPKAVKPKPKPKPKPKAVKPRPKPKPAPKPRKDGPHAARDAFMQKMLAGIGR